MSHELLIENLWKEYATPGEPLVVLRGVNLRIEGAGQSRGAAIVGVSGSGKSTLLNIVGALDRPTRGKVSLDGEEVGTLAGAALARFRAERVGFVFQEHHLLPQCTALENVLLARLAVGKVRTEDASRGRELLQAVGLGDRTGHLPGELSGGERQRVAIARALMNAPALLLCDEPTGNLDASTAAEVGRVLHQMAERNAAILLVVTHSGTGGDVRKELENGERKIGGGLLIFSLAYECIT